MITPENIQSTSSDKTVKSDPPETFLDKATTGKGLLIVALGIFVITILMIFFNNYSLPQGYKLSTKDFWGYLSQALGAMLGLALAAKSVQLTKTQNKISRNQLELDIDAKNPDKAIYIAGVNALLELDSYAVMLVSTGKTYLDMLEYSQSDRDSLRAQLTALLNAANSPFLLQFINRLPNRQKNLGLVRDLRSALFKSAEINLRMPLKNDNSVERYPDWMMARSKWSSQQAVELMSVVQSSIKLLSNVRRLSMEFNCDKQFEILGRVKEVTLTESAAIDSISKNKKNAVEMTNSNCVIEIVDDGESLKNLICHLVDKSELAKKNAPGEYDDNVSSFTVDKNEFAIFDGFKEYNRIAYSEDRRVDGDIVSIGEGLVIVIDNPYGAENHSREKHKARLENDRLNELNKNGIQLSPDKDYREPESIWKIAESLAKLPQESKILRDLHNSTRSLIKSGESYRSNSDVEEHDNYQENYIASTNTWTKVNELIALQKEVSKIFYDEPIKMASSLNLPEHTIVSPKLIWICLNVHGDSQLAGAGKWAYSTLSKNGRFFWNNNESKLYEIRVSNDESK